PAVGDVAVDGEPTDGRDTLGVGTGEPVDDVDVVGALLQQQARAPAPVGVPVLEVEVAAVSHEVPAPDRLHLADPPAGDGLAHGPDDRHVAHVVPDVEPRPRVAGRAQDVVTALDGDGERLVHERGDARGQSGARVRDVQVVGGEDQHPVEVLPEQDLEV